MVKLAPQHLLKMPRKKMSNSAQKGWKEKAIQRSLENRELKKRIKKLMKNRDDWKQRARNEKLTSKEKIKKIKQEFRELKKRI